ncbi:MAG: hypothetical protein EXX96DRAFT_10438 [Benjaminiella poitrasii]|nr:MAG: hypothetical protein EXX96DRAFT_10438 [Benjaminiella poitrasii]
MSDFPEPISSLSTPLFTSQLQRTPIADINTDLSDHPQRPRRHTASSSRPDSAIDLYMSDEEEEEDEAQQQAAFDRISGILSSLIQEANEAVHGIEKERVHLLKTTTTTNTTSPSVHSTRKPHRIIMSTNNRRVSMTLASPMSPMSHSPSSSSTQLKKQSTRHLISPSHRPYTLPNPRRSITSRLKKNTISSNSTNSGSIVTDPVVMESFKRLDTSMALIDSLSRDLVPEQQPKTVIVVDTRHHRLTTTLLLLVPLLHIPHSLITMIFDFFISPSHKITMTTASSSSSFSSMVFWASMFAVMNLMVDQAAVIPKRYVASKIRRMSLPGAYVDTKRNHSNRAAATTTHQQKIKTLATVPVKRSWIPTTIQKQYQFRLGEEDEYSKSLQRRNSI